MNRGAPPSNMPPLRPHSGPGSRPGGPMGARVNAEKPKNAPAERPRSGKLKFSYKEEREFAVIDEEIAALEDQIARCEEEQGLCGSDYVKLQELQARQTELEAQLEVKMERWVYLTELKEKIDAQ